MSTTPSSTRVVDDPSELDELFRRDAHLHIYALADLDEPYWSASTWWRNGDAAFGLVGLPDGETIVYAVSSADPSGTMALAAELVGEVPPTLVTGVTGIGGVFERAGRSLVWQRGYNRFHLTNPDQVPTRDPEVVSLGPDDSDELVSLYAVQPGASFFLPSMLHDETFVGVRDEDRLVAVAGTHVFSRARDVAAIGAVFTHPDHRGRGLGAQVTAGVIDRIGDRVSTIGLNCTVANVAARRIYSRMGFTEALAYDECEVAD